MEPTTIAPWPGISVVIPTWNGLALLAAYLPSVRVALESYPGPWECLVVDDGGSDATERELPALFAAARYIRREYNAGFSSAANTGFNAAAHDLVLLLNNDIRVEPDFVLPLAEHFRKTLSGHEDDLFAVVSQQINPFTDHSVNPAIDGCRTLQFRGGELRLPPVIKTASDKAACDTALANGGCTLFSRAKVLALGGFCLLFNPFYYEDAELSIQALLRKWRIVFEPKSTVVHRPNSTTLQHAAKVNVTSLRNAFFFQWLLLDAAWDWTLHIASIFPRLLSRTLRGRFEYGRGLWQALRRVPELRKARLTRRAGSVRTLSRLLRKPIPPT